MPSVMKEISALDCVVTRVIAGPGCAEIVATTRVATSMTCAAMTTQM